MTPGARLVQKQQKRRSSGNSQLPPANRCLSALAGERDSAEAGSSVAYTIHHQNSTTSSSLNNSGMADIIQLVTSTPCATQRWSIHTATAMLGTRSCRTLAPGGTSQTDSTHCIVSSLESGIACTPTPLSGLEYLPNHIPNPGDHTIITNPRRMQATEQNQTHRQWQLQWQAVSTLQLAVSGGRSIHRCGHSDMTHHVFAIGRLLKLHLWNRPPFTSASDLEKVCYATRRVAKALAEVPHWQ